jgi:hypothetical protein
VVFVSPPWIARVHAVVIPVMFCGQIVWPKAIPVKHHMKKIYAGNAIVVLLVI